MTVKLYELNLILHKLYNKFYILYRYSRWLTPKFIVLYLDRSILQEIINLINKIINSLLNFYSLRFGSLL